MLRARSGKLPTASLVTVKPLDLIPAKNHEERRKYIEQSPSLMTSLEELQEENRRSARSLGAIVPKSIDAIRIRKRNARERAEWYATEKKLRDQTTMIFLRPPMKIDFPEAEFLVRWTCNDRRCTGHESGLKSWPIHQLYRRLKNDSDRDEKTLAKLWHTFDTAKRDVFMFLGTFHNHQTTFGLMDVYAPPKRLVVPSAQLGLF